MIAQRTFVTNTVLQEARQVVNEYRVPTALEWACDVCGMVHIGSSPDSCESCGASNAFTQVEVDSTEIGSRW